MALRDVTSVVFNRGSGPFNEAAALEAYHLVAKMDDADAAEFVFHVVNEVVENAIVENRDLIQKHLDRTIAKALVYADLDAVAEGLSADERQEVKKQLLQAVSKADHPNPFDEGEHPRGSGGRFVIDPHRKIDKPEAERMRAAGEGDIPNHPDMGDMTKEQKEFYRGQYAQIAAKLNGALNGEKDVVLHYADSSSQAVSAASGSRLAGAIRPHEAKNVIGLEVADYKPTIAGRVADLTGSLGSGAEFIANESPTKPGNGRSEFARQWYSAHPTNGTQQMYNRIGAGSELLGSMTSDTSRLGIAAKFGSFVGQHGPAAEQVFGPPSRRMAYRYRGTERKPDRQLITAYGNAVHSAKTQSGRHTAEQNDTRAPDWQERQAGREQIVGWLQQEGRAPSKALSNLQLAAGHTPPSEGVLLNAQGQIVTTAVGAADDWYLPFNLKHLSALKGGEYIRSRSSGGLTTEDIYTGLMTGARRVTVVSRSGVYSIEFDPELRGGRRNNDKALRMTKRYGELLDAVQSGKVERQSLSPEARREISNEVTQMYGSRITTAERRTAEDALIKERQDNPAAIQAKIDDLDDERASIEAERELVPDEKIAFTEKRLGLLSQKEYFYRLNGLGYKAAQEALKEQFPYYVASADTTWTTKHAPVGPNDPGYVEPGALRPTAARANLFGGARGPNGGRINAQTKAESARTADRAKPFVDRYGDDDAAASVGEDGPDEPKGPSGGGQMPASRKDEAQLAAEGDRVRTMRKAAANVHANLGWVDRLVDKDGKTPLPGTEALRTYRKMDEETFKIAMLKQGAVEKFHGAINDAINAVGDTNFPYPGRSTVGDMVGLDEAVGPKGGGKYSQQKATVSPEKVFSFPDLTQAQKVSAAARPLALTEGTAGEASSADLTAEAKMNALISEILTDYTGPHKSVEGERVLAAEGLYPQSDRGKDIVAGYFASPERLATATEEVHIQRAVKAQGAGIATKQPSVASGAEEMLKELEATKAGGHGLSEAEAKEQMRQLYIKDHGLPPDWQPGDPQ